MTAAETWKESAAFWSYRALEQLAPALPEELGRRIAIAFGGLAWRGLKGVRATVTANQGRALGLDPADERVRRATREAFELYARYWYDTFRLRVTTPTTLKARVDIVGADRIDAALSQGKGCLTVLPHMGNWDVAGCVFAAAGYRIATVAEELRPARLFALLRHHRERLGLRILPLGDPAVLRELEQLLAQNWIVALLADRSLSGRGVEVEMFGAARRVPAGPARLALATGAPLLVSPIYTTPSGWRIVIGEPLEIERSGDIHADVTALSRLMAADLERAIAVRPSDWHLFQPGWSDTAVDASHP